jgi:thymidylate synthase (FAD)
LRSAWVSVHQRVTVQPACEAFEDYRLHAMHLTGLEIEAIRSGQPLNSTNKREVAEWEAKRSRLGL